MIPNCKKIYLCAPDLSKLCILNGIQTSTVDFHPQVKGYSELSFTVDRFLSINGEYIESNGYNDLKPYMYLYLEDIGYFIMDPPEVTYDGNQEIKSISAYSAEREFENKDWVGIKINYGTSDSMEYSNTDDSNKDEYGFANRYVTMYNEEDESLSFLTQILKKMSSKWSIGYVAPELINAKIPFLEIDSENLYAVMTSEVGPRMSCLFVFDYLHFTVNVFHKDYIDKAFDLDTGIYIGFRNLENNVTINVDSDSIYTRFSVQGQDGLEFRDVNYGDNTIINLDYFLGEPYMDDEMVQKYQLWQEFRAQYIEEYKELAKQYNELVEKREERTYKVPSDESYWKNWENINTEGLIQNLNYFRQQLELLQISVEEREPEEYLDSNGNYLPLLLDGQQQHKISALKEGTRYKIISTDQIETVVHEFLDVTTDNISVSTTGLINCGVDVAVGNKFVYVADLENAVDHEVYLQRLYDKINIYGGYYTYKEIIEYIIPYIKLALSNSEKIDEDKVTPNYDVPQDWEMYGLEELQGVRDSYEDKLKTLDQYSLSYEELLALEQEAFDLEDCRTFLDGYMTGHMGNTDLNNRQPWVWTDDNIWMASADDDYLVLSANVGDVLTMAANVQIAASCSSICYSCLLQTEEGTPIFLTNDAIRDYLYEIASFAKLTDKSVDKQQLLKLDAEGIEQPDGTVIKNIVFGVSNDLSYVNNNTMMLRYALDDYEKGDKKSGLRHIASIADIELPEDYFDGKTYNDALQEFSDTLDKKIEENQSKRNVGINYIGEDGEDAYENSFGRLEYKRMTEALGDEETPGTILYQIKKLKEEISGINDELSNISAITNQYATIVQYDIDADTLDSLTLLPQEMITQRRFSLFNERQLLTFDSLLRDTDYVNSNILTTSIMSLEDKMQVEEDLLADSDDKLSEVSQPQFVFSCDVDNFFRLTDYADWAIEFQPNDGSGVINKPPIGLLKYIMVGLRDDYSVKLRIIGYRWNPCEITPDLTLEFSNMITGRSGRSDLTQLLDQENNRGSKNSIRIGTGTADSAQEYVSALMDLLKNNSIFVKSVQNIASGTTGTADVGSIESIISSYLASHGVGISEISVDNIIGLDGKFRTLTSQYIDAKYISSQVIDAKTGYFKEVFSGKINAKQISGEEGDFDTLAANVISAGEANIKTIAAGTITAQNIISGLGDFTTLFATTAFTDQLTSNVITSLTTSTSNAYIANLVSDYVSIGDLKAGNITVGTENDPTSGIKIVSANGNMVMNGRVLQFGKKNTEGEFDVNIQLGYGVDDENNEIPSLIIRDDNGAVLFTSQGIIGEDGKPIAEKGINAAAIADELIVNNMIEKGTIDKDRLSFDVIETNKYGGIDITKIYDGNGNQFGLEWTSFKNNTESVLNQLNDLAKSVYLYGANIFFEKTDGIIPPQLTIFAEVKNGAKVQKWLIDDVETTEGVTSDNMSITIPSSALDGKRSLQVKVVTVEGLYDIITVYKVADGKNGDTPYTVTLKSSKGELFKEDDSTVVTCLVYHGTVAVTPKSYEWLKWDDETEKFIPIEGAGNTKQITVNVSSNDIKQVIKCRVEI